MASSPDRPDRQGPRRGADGRGVERGTEAQLSALELSRLHARAAFPPGGRELFQRVAQLVELAEGQEFLTVPCGRGVTTRFLAESTGASGAGVDPDEGMVEAARDDARAHGLEPRLHYEHAPLEDLPYKNEVFDLVIGEIGLAAARDVPAAVEELVRVTRPMGMVVLIQLTWLRLVPTAERERLVGRLGVRPYLPVEWKQMLRDAGVVDVQVEDWGDALAAPRQHLALGGLAGVTSLRDRLRIYYEAWRSWGWRGLLDVRRHDRELHRILGHERLLGLSVFRGTKWKGE